MANLTNAQKRELKRKGSILETDFDGQEFTGYHHRITGQEFPRLPADATSIKEYMKKDLLPGPASEDLRKKWKDSEPERKAVSIKRLKEAQNTPEYRVMMEEKEKFGEDRFQDSVKNEVQRQLEALGLKIPETSERTEEIVEEVKESTAPEQLRLFN